MMLFAVEKVPMDWPEAFVLAVVAVCVTVAVSIFLWRNPL